MTTKNQDGQQASPTSTTAAPFPAARGATVALPYWEPKTDIHC